MSCMKNGFIEGYLLDDRFETLSPLNHGSFGLVFLAKDRLTEDLVAIKCLTKPSSANPTSEVSLFEHLVELQAHTRLGNHPNLVNLLHAFETDAHMFLVLEYCSMGDLYEAIRLSRGPLETNHVRDFMVQLVDAVEFMHSKGLYHRDIKPENIFLNQDGTMKLGDFGLSTTETWSYDISVGSDRYMAPEQYDPSETGYSPAKADIWAVGICLLNVLFARNPFVTPSESDVLFTDFVRNKQSLFDIFPAMSQDTFEVLEHALSIDPEKRSLDAVRAALDRVISFTADDDMVDDFCTEDREIVSATANRQPLRTPSIQSPPIESGGAFPWAQALHMSPRLQDRQLSVIPDLELDHEDFFPEEKTPSWYTPTGESASASSLIDSALGASIKSMNLREPKPRNPVVVAGSLPVSASKPISAMSSVFGKKDDLVSKSWSDLWDEEEEELEDARRRFNERNWSSESIDEDLTIGRKGLSEIVNASVTNSRNGSVSHEVDVFGIDTSDDIKPASSEVHHSFDLPLYSPPMKRNGFVDKWVALGNRRRAASSDKEESAKPFETRKRTNTGGSWRRGLKNLSGNAGWGFGMNSVSSAQTTTTTTFGRSSRKSPSWDRKENNFFNKAKEIPGAGAVRIMDDWRREQHPFQHYTADKTIPEDEDGDVEWVGGWPLHL